MLYLENYSIPYVARCKTVKRGEIRGTTYFLASKSRRENRNFVSRIDILEIIAIVVEFAIKITLESKRSIILCLIILSQ